MQTMTTSVHLGWALVTSRGIYYEDLFYSCRQAIKKQWFMKAAEKGCWAIRVVAPIFNSKILFIVGTNNIHIAYSLNPR
jgi:hypothetical protein